MPSDTEVPSRPADPPARPAPKPVAANPAPDAASNAAPAPAPIGAGTAGAVAETQASVLGQMVWLLLQSPAHRHVFVSELEWRLLPPLTLGQARIFKKEKEPFAFVTWALASEGVEGRLRAMPGKLTPAEWKSGARMVIVDVVAPFGGGDACVNEVLKSAVESARAGTGAG
jgi:cytolysin-activating lysine-acyltransferase